MVRSDYHIRNLVGQRSVFVFSFWFLCLILSFMPIAAAEDGSAESQEIIDSSSGSHEHSLRAVLQMAYESNPTLRAARANLDVYSEQIPQASAGWKPTVTAEGSIVTSDNEGSNFGGGDGSTAKDLQLGFNQPVFRGGQTLAAYKKARKTVNAQQALLEATMQNVMLDAATAYMNVLRDEAVLELSEQNERVIKQQHEATSERYEVGELTKTDVAQAEARLARARSDMISSGGDLETSKAVYEQIIGVRPVGLTYSDLDMGIPESLDDAIELAMEKNPELIAAQYLHKQSEHEVRRIFSELLPSVDFFGSWNRTYDPQPGLTEEQTTKSLGLSASIPLYQAGAVKSRVREAKYNANKRLIEISEVKRRIKQQVVKFWEEWKVAESHIESRRLQVKASMVANEGVHAEADLGARTVLDALDADQELLDARVALVSAKRDEVVARFSLAVSIGLVGEDVWQNAGENTTLDTGGEQQD